MSSSEWPLFRVQQHLDRGLRVPPEDRAALEAARWPDHLRVRVAAPPWYAPMRRLSWDSAYKAALALGDEPRTERAIVVPVWHSDNGKGTEPSTDWRLAGVVLLTDSKLWERLEVGEPLLARLVVEVQRLGQVEPTGSGFTAEQTRRFFTVRQIETAESVDPAPRPLSIVPPFSTRTELGLAASELSLPEFDAVTRAIGEGAFARPSMAHPPPR